MMQLIIIRSFILYGQVLLDNIFLYFRFLIWRQMIISQKYDRLSKTNNEIPIEFGFYLHLPRNLQ